MNHVNEKHAARFGQHVLLSGEFLDPSVVIEPDSNLGEVAAKNIGAVSLAVHPIVHDLRGSRLAFGNIFASCTIRNSEFVHHIEW